MSEVLDFIGRGVRPLPRRFICALCGEMFVGGQSPTQAMQEFYDNFPDSKCRMLDCALVCDRCYRPFDLAATSARLPNWRAANAST